MTLRILKLYYGNSNGTKTKLDLNKVFKQRRYKRFDKRQNKTVHYINVAYIQRNKTDIQK